MSVLIVEPSLPLRRVIRSFIKGFDADIYECGDAAAALRLCPPAPPEWVLFNLEIRDVEGVNAIVKLTGKWRDAKVVALSS